jgi:hypothetical protein
MIEAGIRPAQHAVDTNGADKSRLAMRLWTLLHAQALLQGSIAGAGCALNAEDDRWRLAAHRESTHRRDDTPSRIRAALRARRHAKPKTASTAVTTGVCPRGFWS